MAGRKCRETENCGKDLDDRKNMNQFAENDVTTFMP